MSLSPIAELLREKAAQTVAPCKVDFLESLDEAVVYVPHSTTHDHVALKEPTKPRMVRGMRFLYPNIRTFFFFQNLCTLGQVKPAK